MSSDLMFHWLAECGMHACMQAAQPKQPAMHAMSKGQNLPGISCCLRQIMWQIAVCMVCFNALVGCMQGVQQYAFFFKSIADAHNLRQRVCECFERAALPTITDQVCQAHVGV